MTEMGQRIRRLREERRMSQDDLGLAIGVSGRTVGNWERGANLPRNSIGALEAYFRVSLVDGEPMDADEVVSAIERSDLTRAERAELVAHYWKMRESRERGAAG